MKLLAGQPRPEVAVHPDLAFTALGGGRDFHPTCSRVFDLTPAPSSTACSSAAVFLALWLYYDRRDNPASSWSGARRRSTASAATALYGAGRLGIEQVPALRPRKYAAEVLSFGCLEQFRIVLAGGALSDDRAEVRL